MVEARAGGTSKPRTLIVVRHAKAEGFASTDEARELTPRGLADASKVGEFLAAEGLTPDYVVVSPAERTRQTWNALAEAGGFAVEPVFDSALYDGGTDAVIEALRVAPEAADVVMYVGHNPTAQLLVSSLDDGAGDPVAAARISGDYPTAAVTILEQPDAWGTLCTGTARIKQFYVGRAQE